MKVAVNRPFLPSARYPEATVDEILSHLENWIHDPSAAVPRSLAGFSFRRLQSCTDVISNFLNPGGRGARGARGVDMVFIDRGTEATNRGHTNPVLDTLFERDVDTTKLFFDKYHSSQSVGADLLSSPATRPP
jgi:hypothetical protein